MINSKTIKIKSEELDIPFANIMSGCAVETVVTMIAEGSYKEELWLCNPHVLGIDVYKKKPSLEVVYKYSGKKNLIEFCQQFCLDLQEHYKKAGFQVECATREDIYLGQSIHLELSLEEMYIPIIVNIEQIDSHHLFPKEERFRLLMENDKTILLYLYPLEQMVAYHLTEIIKHLELLNDMESYLVVYDILKKYPIEGRKVKAEMEKLCETKRIALSEKAYELWSTYEDYTYMKKKWKVLLRREKRETPSWQEAFRLIHIFFKPIWEAACKEEVFFGDWMPEIERFLE